MTRKKRASVLLASIILIVVLSMPLVGCFGGSEPVDGNTAPVMSLPDLQNALNELTSRVASIEGRLGSVEANSPTAVDLGPINQQLAEIQASINSTSARLTTLEQAQVSDNSSNGGSSSSGEVVRWNFDVCRISFDKLELLNPDGSVNYTCSDCTHSDIDIVVRYDSIKEEDSYDIELTIENDSTLTAVLYDAVIELQLRPRDHVAINEDDTYLDSDSILEVYDDWLEWDTDFKMDSKDLCKGITFESDEFDVTIEPSDHLDADLLLDLYYA